MFFTNFCFVLQIKAQTINELRDRKEKIKKEIEYINNLLDETGKNSKASLNKLSMLGQQIELRKNLIIDYNSQLSLLKNSIDDNFLAIDMMTDDLEKLRDQYANMIRQAYRNKGNYSQLVFLLSSENFNQAYKRMLYIREMAQYRKKQLEQISALRTVIEAQTKDLNARKNEQTHVINQQMAETSKLNLEKQKQSSYYDELKQKEKELKRNLNKQQKIEEQLQREIEKLIAQEAKKSKETPPTPEDKLLSDNFEKNKGRFPWPTQSGIITDRFGEHAHPVMKRITIKNDGIDITTNPGEKARAIFNGTVSKVFAVPGGMAIIIRHGEYMTVYSTLKEVYVKPGDQVTTKQDIGLIYSDPFDDNKTTLKFQIRKEVLKLNPEEWISK